MQWLIQLGGLDSFLVDVSLKAGAILGVAWIASLVLAACRGSAASRHAVWALATASALGLPLMAAMLPTCYVALPWQNAAMLTVKASINGCRSWPIVCKTSGVCASITSAITRRVVCEFNNIDCDRRNRHCGGEAVESHFAECNAIAVASLRLADRHWPDTRAPISGSN